jgi:uncharacterized protein with GYD domain
MAKYIALCNWTDQGIRNVKDSAKRLDAARDLAAKLGSKIVDFHMTMGAYDMVVTMEAPDDETAARFNLMLGMSGNLRTVTLKAFDETSYRKVVGSL